MLLIIIFASSIKTTGKMIKIDQFLIYDMDK